MLVRGFSPRLCVSVALLASAGCARSGPDAFEPPVIWGGEGATDGQFTRPRAITCSADGMVYVADFTGRIQKFDSTGRFLLSLMLPPFRAGKPAGLGIASNGDLLVGETHAFRLSRYSPDGRFLRRWGEYGPQEGRFLLIRDVASDRDGNIYVADYGYVEEMGLVSRVQKFTADGALLMALGKQGTAAGELDRPEGVALDGEGNVYVCEAGNHRVQVFSPEGAVLRAWGKRGTAPGEFEKPHDIDVGPDGRVYVADMNNHRVQVFTAAGDLVAVWGSLGTGRRALAAPWGLAVDASGDCFICDTGNHRIVKIRLRPSDE